jgi:hypothetical protein
VEQKVDLTGVLSNSGTQGVLAHAAQTVASLDVDAVRLADHPPTSRRWRIVDRLHARAITQLVSDGLAGVPKRELAMRYDISLSSVKRLLRTER